MVGVYVKGTLDQIRYEDGVYRVWDLKTGKYLDRGGAKAEYQFQQAGYVLAARQTTGLDVQPGGLIWCQGYDQPRGNPFIELNVSVEDCEAKLDRVVERVEELRQGKLIFLPSDSACKFCPFKQYPDCSNQARSLL